MLKCASALVWPGDCPGYDSLQRFKSLKFIATLGKGVD